MSDKVVTLAPACAVLQVADMLEQVAAELREMKTPSMPQAALVIAFHGENVTDTKIHFAGGVRNIAEGLGLFDLGKAQMLMADG